MICRSKNIYELHLRTLSNNEPHPHAHYSRIPCLPGSSQDIALSDLNPAVTIQVIGDLVAVLFKDLILDLGARLEIWNWKLGPKHSVSRLSRASRGEMLTKIKSVMHRVAGIDDFTFLSEDSFLLVRPSEKLEVYKFAPPTSRSSIPQCLVSLELPLLSNQYRYWYITMSSNPTPGHVPHFPHSSSTASGLDPSNLNLKGTSSQQLYYPAPNERVLACCLYIFDITQPQDASVRSFVFFVNVGTFLKPVEHWLSAMPNHCFASPLNRGICRMHTEHGESSSPGRPSGVHHQASGMHPSHIHSDPNSVPNDCGQNTNNPLTSITSNPAQHIVGDNGTLTSFALNQGAPGTIPQSYQSLPPGDFETDSDLTSSVYSTSSLSSSLSSSSQAPLFLSEGEFSSPAGGTRNPCIWRMQPGSYPSIPWEVWGPQNTRWFNGNWRTDWQHATYGLRTADSVRVRQKSSTNGKSAAMPSNMENTQNEDDLENENECVSDMELDEEIDILGGEEDEAEIFNDGPGPLRILRVRDYNPCSIAQASEYLRNGVDSMGMDASRPLFKGETWNENTKGRTLGNSRLRVVTEPSITPVHGVYKEDIQSWLPYVEVLSKETFDVTDVMLDDRRLLLLKVCIYLFQSLQLS